MGAHIDNGITNITSLEELMAHWKNKQPFATTYVHNKKETKLVIDHQKNFFIPDGIVDQSAWNDLPHGQKILFILKEAYETDPTKPSWSLNDELREYGPWSSIWNRVSEWAYGILNTSTTTIAKYRDLEKSSANLYLRKIAVMNIKKSAGVSNSVEEEIAAYADADAKELLREIELIDPDVVVCGYTFGDINRISGSTVKQGSNENWFYFTDAIGGKERLFIDYYHPANQYPKLLNYYGIVGIYQQALISKRSEQGGNT